MPERSRGTDESIIAQLLLELEQHLDIASAGIAENRDLIEGNRASIDTLISAMQIHTQALNATNTILRDMRLRLAKLEAQALRNEKPPAD